MSKTFPATKGPDERKDYWVEWPPRLTPDEDTIASSSWAIIDGDGSLQIDADSFTDTIATVWLSGGVVGTNYQLRNQIVTAGGRTYEQIGKLRCRTK